MTHIFVATSWLLLLLALFIWFIFI
jgi:hypothetical protein